MSYPTAEHAMLACMGQCKPQRGQCARVYHGYAPPGLAELEPSLLREHAVTLHEFAGKEWRMECKSIVEWWQCTQCGSRRTWGTTDPLRRWAVPELEPEAAA